LQASWNLFDGGAARAQYRQAKQRAQENGFRFANTRNDLRFEVEEVSTPCAKATGIFKPHRVKSCHQESPCGLLGYAFRRA
jgi:hypothetical protein